MRSYIISGLSGSGKTTAAEYTTQLGYDTVSVGELVRREYNKQNPNESIGNFVLRRHEKDGRTVFVREALAEFDEQVADRDDTSAGVVIEGVHSYASAAAVRERFGETPVVWLQAPFSLRVQRCQQRNKRDTSEELFYRDLRELNAGMSTLAQPFGHEYHISNDRSPQALEERLDAIFA